MGSNYIVLKVGTHRVLLVNHNGESATMSRPVNGDYVIFDYTACDVVGSVTVQDGDQEPTPEDILVERLEGFRLSAMQRLQTHFCPQAVNLFYNLFAILVKFVSRNCQPDQPLRET